MNHKFETPKLAIGNRKSQISSLINSSTHQPIHFFMQNKPNSNRPATNDQQQINAGHNQRATRDERPATNYTKRTQFAEYPETILYKTNPILLPTHQPNTQKTRILLTSFPKKSQTPSILPPLFCCFFITFYLFFYYFYSLFCTFRHLLQLFETNTLNSMYNKDLHKYSHPLINSSTHLPIHSFTHSLIYSFMQNKPNSHRPATRNQQQINAGHAGHNWRETRDQRRIICKTNPIYPPTPLHKPRPTPHGARVTRDEPR